MGAVIDYFYSGTILRNEVIRATEKEVEVAWHQRWEEWKVGMEAAVVSADKTRAANVVNLVNFPMLPFEGVSGEQAYFLSLLTESLQRLSVFISQ